MSYQGVKFTVKFLNHQVPEDPRLNELQTWCQKFDELKLSPLYEVGSSGNLSFRYKTGNEQFIITASSTYLGKISPDSFVKVEAVDFENKIVTAVGKKEPSSESMLHYAIYKQRPDVNAVFHGHCQKILDSAHELNIPVTLKEEPYGTPELVQRVLDILNDNNFLILKNHGFIALGKTMGEAGNQTLQILEKCSE